jgi:hypothetical protein
MTTQKLMLAALLACTFAPAYAEEPEQAAGQPRVERRVVTRQGDAMTFNFDELTFPAGQGFRFEAFMHGRPIKNAPYSAQLVNERQQNLPDGNQIANKHTTASYRDSAGRTRQEVRDNNGEVRAVTIHDPVAGATYILHPQDKTATKVPTNPEAVRAAAEAARAAGEAARGAGAEAARAAGEAARGAAAAARAAAAAQREAMREQVEQMRREGKLPTVERRTGPNGEEIVIKRVERAGNRSGDGQNEVRVRIEQNMAMMEGARAAQLAPLAGAFGDSKWAAKATTKDLGTREMDGVKAEGKLRTYEIPAGEVGNRNPIVVSHESWYSPDLQITLYTKHSDPRTGDQIYRVEGLKREEPAAALFTIPSDYTVRDVMANLKNKAEPKAK